MLVSIKWEMADVSTVNKFSLTVGYAGILMYPLRFPPLPNSYLLFLPHSPWRWSFDSCVLRYWYMLAVDPCGMQINGPLFPIYTFMYWKEGSPLDIYVTRKSVVHVEPHWSQRPSARVWVKMWTGLSDTFPRTSHWYVEIEGYEACFSFMCAVHSYRGWGVIDVLLLPGPEGLPHTQMNARP